MTAPERVPAIVAAGDGKAAKAVRGQSKVYLQVAARSLVSRVVAALQQVPEVSEVWVVGDAERLAATLGADPGGARLTKPLWIVPQYRNLFENVWLTYRRMLPGAGPEGRDPGPEDADRPVLYLSADLPFATPEEISSFVQRSLAAGSDYAMGVVPESAMEGFYPRQPGEAGIKMAYFNVREGRYRLSNMHLVRPGHIGNRPYIEEMYEHRYQKQLGNILGLAWRILRDEGGGPSVVLYYSLMHLAGLADRHGWRRLADRLRQAVSFERVDRACSSLLRTRFRLIVTEAGGCAVDIDNEHDLDAACERFAEWRAQQERRARELYGPVVLSEFAGATAPALTVLPAGSPEMDASGEEA
jgi:hypothetical protein